MMKNDVLKKEMTRDELPLTGDGIEGKTRPAALLFILVFIAGVVAAAVLSQYDRFLCVAAVGALFTFFGAAAVADKKNRYPDERIFPAVFLLIGLGMTAVPLWLRYAERSGGYTEEQLADMKLMIVSAVFMAAGLMVMILPFTADMIRKKRCTVQVEAVCVKLLARTDDETVLYSPVWEYQADGRLIRKQEKGYSNIGVPKVGDTREIFVNPDDPADIYRKNGSHEALMFVLGLIFLAAGAAIMVMSGKV